MDQTFGCDLIQQRNHRKLWTKPSPQSHKRDKVDKRVFLLQTIKVDHLL